MQQMLGRKVFERKRCLTPERFGRATEEFYCSYDLGFLSFSSARHFSRQPIRTTLRCAPSAPLRFALRCAEWAPSRFLLSLRGELTLSNRKSFVLAASDGP